MKNLNFQIVGKIGGASAEELEMFERVENEITKLDFFCFNPLKHCISQEPYPALIECLKNIISQKPILYVLPTYVNSLGSSMELFLADELKLIKITSLGELMKFKNGYVYFSDEENQLILDIVNRYIKFDETITLNGLRSKVRNKRNVLARASISYILHNIFNWKHDRIGNAVNIDRTTINYYVYTLIPDLLAMKYPIDNYKIFRNFLESYEK